MENNLFFRLVWTITSICHLRIEKEKRYFHSGNVLTKLYTKQVFISWGENKKKWKLQRRLAEHKTSIFRLKFGKLLWRIWKMKSSASSLNLCPLNSPKLQIPEIKAFRFKGKTRLSWNTAAQKFAEAVHVEQYRGRRRPNKFIENKQSKSSS